MKNLKSILWLAILVASVTSINAQSAHKLLRLADSNYDKGNYAMAEEQYRKSLEKEPTLNGHHNLGVTTFEQERFEEAAESFESAINKTEDATAKSQVFYNLGNTYFAAEDKEQSFDAYKEAIRLNPNDADARKNLYLAKVMRQQEQKQEQQKECDNPQPSDEQSDEEKKEEEKKDQEDQEPQDQEDQDQESSQDSEESSDKESPSEGVGEEQDLSKEDALKLLQVIEDEEKKVQEKLRKFSGKKNKSKKDW